MKIIKSFKIFEHKLRSIFVDDDEMNSLLDKISEPEYDSGSNSQCWFVNVSFYNCENLQNMNVDHNTNLEEIITDTKLSLDALEDLNVAIKRVMDVYNNGYYKSFYKFITSFYYSDCYTS